MPRKANPHLNDKQILAIRCACADLIGAMEARNQNDVEVHDWKAHSLTIDDLIEAFDFLSDFSEAANTANKTYETTATSSSPKSKPTPAKEKR